MTLSNVASDQPEALRNEASDQHEILNNGASDQHDIKCDPLTSSPKVFWNHFNEMFIIVVIVSPLSAFNATNDLKTSVD